MIRETINWVKAVYATPNAEVLALRKMEIERQQAQEAKP
jgi:hypothetical protein